MSIKWIQVVDNRGELHIFDNNLEGHYLRATYTGDTRLDIEYPPKTGFKQPKFEASFVGYSSFKVMREG